MCINIQCLNCQKRAGVSGEAEETGIKTASHADRFNWYLSYLLGVGQRAGVQTPISLTIIQTLLILLVLLLYHYL